MRVSVIFPLACWEKFLSRVEGILLDPLCLLLGA